MRIATQRRCEREARVNADVKFRVCIRFRDCQLMALERPPAYTRVEISDCDEHHPSASVRLHLRGRFFASTPAYARADIVDYTSVSLRLHLRIRGRILFTVSAPMFCGTERSSNSIWPRLFAYTCVYAGRYL